MLRDRYCSFVFRSCGVEQLTKKQRDQFCNHSCASRAPPALLIDFLCWGNSPMAFQTTGPSLRAQCPRTCFDLRRCYPGSYDFCSRQLVAKKVEFHSEFFILSDLHLEEEHIQSTVHFSLLFPPELLVRKKVLRRPERALSPTTGTFVPIPTGLMLDVSKGSPPPSSLQSRPRASFPSPLCELRPPEALTRAGSLYYSFF